jgi:hypothetical protein
MTYFAPGFFYLIYLEAHPGRDHEGIRLRQVESWPLRLAGMGIEVL